MWLWLVFIKHCTKHLTSIKSFNPSRQSFEVNHTCNLQTRKPKLRDQRDGGRNRTWTSGCLTVECELFGCQTSHFTGLLVSEWNWIQVEGLGGWQWQREWMTVNATRCKEQLIGKLAFYIFEVVVSMWSFVVRDVRRATTPEYRPEVR